MLNLTDRKVNVEYLKTVELNDGEEYATDDTNEVCAKTAFWLAAGVAFIDNSIADVKIVRIKSEFHLMNIGIRRLELRPKYLGVAKKLDTIEAKLWNAIDHYDMQDAIKSEVKLDLINLALDINSNGWN